MNIATDINKYESVNDIESLKNHQLKTLIVRGNKKICTVSEIISDTLVYLDCRDIGIYKEDVDELVKVMPNCKIVHNAKSKKQAAKARKKKIEDRHKAFMQRPSLGEEYPSNRDAFDSDEQYNDWLNH